MEAILAILSTARAGGIEFTSADQYYFTTLFVGFAVVLVRDWHYYLASNQLFLLKRIGLWVAAGIFIVPFAATYIFESVEAAGDVQLCDVQVLWRLAAWILPLVLVRTALSRFRNTVFLQRRAANFRGNVERLENTRDMLVDDDPRTKTQGELTHGPAGA